MVMVNDVVVTCVDDCNGRVEVDGLRKGATILVDNFVDSLWFSHSQDLDGGYEFGESNVHVSGMRVP